MANPSRFSLGGALALCGLVFLALGGLAASGTPAAAQASGGGCVVQTGKWTGDFQLHITGMGTANKLDVSDQIFYTGDVAITIAPDCTITGAFSNVQLLVTTRFAPDPLGVGFAGCSMPMAMTVTSGKVTKGKLDQPLFTLSWTAKNGKPDCGSAAQYATQQMTAAMAAAGGASSSDTWAWQDDLYEYEGPNFPVRSGTQPWGAKKSALIDSIPAQFNPEYNYIFHLKAEAPPAPTATVEGSYRDVFVAGLGPVNDVFTTHVDWKGGPPGTVSVDLNGKTYPATVDGAIAKTEPIDVSAFPPGTYSVLSTAKGPGGLLSTATMTVAVVPVPTWGKDFALHRDSEGPCVPGSSDERVCVFYAGEEEMKWPVGRSVPHFGLPDWFPIVGGDWGFDPLTMHIKVAPRSDVRPHDLADHRGEAPVTGGGGIAIVGNKLTLTMRSNSATRVETTQDGLNFLTGEIGAGVAAPSDVRLDDPDDHVWTGQLDLLSVLPQSVRDTIYKIPVVGGAIQYALPNAGEYEAHVGLTGGAALGVGNDGKVTIGNGQIILAINGYAGVGPNSVIGGAQLRGSISGEITLGLAPIAIQKCQLAFNFFIEASLVGKIPINSTPITACDQAKQASLDGDRLPPGWSLTRGETAAPLVLTALVAGSGGSVLTYPARDGWKPFANVATKVTTGVPAGRAETLLVTNATAFNAAPAIAAGPNGAVAVAFVGEDPTVPRPKTFHVVVRLFDGKTWSRAVNMADGTNAETAPAVAFDKNGHVIVVWTALKPGAKGFDASITETTFDAADIAGADIDPATGKFTRFKLSNDGLPDGEPRIARASDGSLWIGWRSGAAGGGNVFQFKAAHWTGSATPPKPETIAIDGYAGSWSLAAGDGEHVALALEVDDGTTHTVELATRDNAKWSPPRKLAPLTAPSSVAAAFDASMKPVVVWNDGAALSGTTGGQPAATWVKGTAQPLAAGIGKDGSLTVVAGAGTVIETLSRSAAGAWSAATPLTGSFATDTSVGIALRDAGGWLAVRAAITDRKAAVAANADIVLSVPAG